MKRILSIFRRSKRKVDVNQVARREVKKVGATADNPIQDPVDDALGRAKVAKNFASQLLSLDVSEGVVVGVLGPWGSGKTSFVNIARTYLDDSGIAVLNFNPWMFSGTEQLVDSFFVEISAQLRLTPELSEVGKGLEEYGEAFAGMGWLPLVGPWIERGRAATSLISKMLQHRREGVGSRRAKVEKALRGLSKPLIVVLDDIDRLTTGEIRDIFKLVRLTANFPNIIYVVAFDRARVEEALAEQGIPGRDYLEKILQVGIDLPEVPPKALIHQTLKAIDDALSQVDQKGTFDEDSWPDVFMEVIRPLVRNMRDVRRYAASVHGTVTGLGGQVALVDVLALEAVRVFLPDVFRRLHISIDGLTQTSNFSSSGSDDSPYLKQQIEQLIDSAGAHAPVVRDVIERLFPAALSHIGGSCYVPQSAHRWLRERRVAHEDVLRFYLERVLGEGLQAFTHAEEVWARMLNRKALEDYFRLIEPEMWEDVISSLEVYEDEFEPEHVIPGSVALLNLLPDLPERERGMFEFGSAMVVGRVVYRLVRTIKTPDKVEEAVRRILPELNTLSAKNKLITIVGYRENAGHELVSEEAARQLEAEWRAEVRAAAPSTLTKEQDLLRVLMNAKRDASSNEALLVVPDSPAIVLRLLRSAHSYALSQQMGTRAVRRSPRLAWDVLVEICGGERELGERIAQLRPVCPKGELMYLELAEKYLGGWRPGDFGGD